MTEGQTNWATRLCVAFKPANGASDIITPIDSFECSDEMNIDIIDSIDGHNLGYSYGNPRYTLSFEVKTVNKSVFRKIYAVAKSGTRFSIAMATVGASSDDWFLDAIEFRDCVVNSSSQTVDSTGKVPVFKISGLCLDTAAANNGEVITTTHTSSFATGTLN